MPQFINREKWKALSLKRKDEGGKIGTLKRAGFVMGLIDLARLHPVS